MNAKNKASIDVIGIFSTSEVAFLKKNKKKNVIFPNLVADKILKYFQPLIGLRIAHIPDYARRERIERPLVRKTQTRNSLL